MAEKNVLYIYVCVYKINKKNHWVGLGNTNTQPYTRIPDSILESPIGLDKIRVCWVGNPPPNRLFLSLHYIKSVDQQHNNLKIWEVKFNF